MEPSYDQSEVFISFDQFSIVSELYLCNEYFQSFSLKYIFQNRIWRIVVLRCSKQWCLSAALTIQLNIIVDIHVVQA